MKRTYNKTITPEGMKRKTDRLIVKALANKFPAIYNQLAREAREVILEDNHDPRSKLVTGGLDRIHSKSDLLRALEVVAEFERRQWVEELIAASEEERRNRKMLEAQ